MRVHRWESTRPAVVDCVMTLLVGGAHAGVLCMSQVPSACKVTIFSSIKNQLPQAPYSSTQDYSFDPMDAPPSTDIVAPFTKAPARLPKNRQAPATSSGEPIRPRGMPTSILSLNLSSVAFIIFDSKGPQAKVLELLEVNMIL